MEVAATFGSVGDIIQICGLIKALINTLKDSRGSRERFRSLIEHLNHLELLLQEFDELAQVCDRSTKYESVGRRARLEILSCRSPIETFKTSLDKYRKSLRVGGSGNRLKDGYVMVQFAIAHKEEVAAFRQYIRDRVQTMTAIVFTAKL